MKKSKRSQRETTTVRIRPSLWATCKIQAIQEGRYASDLLEDALTTYLADSEKLLKAS